MPIPQYLIGIVTSLPVNYQWTASEVPMKYRWSTDEVPMKYQWSTDEVRVKYRWNTSEVWMKYHWSRVNYKWSIVLLKSCFSPLVLRPSQTIFSMALCKQWLWHWSIISCTCFIQTPAHCSFTHHYSLPIQLVWNILYSDKCLFFGKRNYLLVLFLSSRTCSTWTFWIS